MNNPRLMGVSKVWRVVVAIATVGLSVSISGLPTTASPLLSAGRATREAQIQKPWRAMTEAEVQQAWRFVLNSRLGIAALNQLAIEGFISPTCPKSWYVNETAGGFQSMLRVQCPEPRGASIAVSYQDIRVIFNRFEDNIENFTVDRVIKE